MPPSKICLICGTRFQGQGNRCEQHPRPPRYKANVYPYAERKRMRETVANHIKRAGYTCPGHRREAHEAYDLTADHVTPASKGGLGGPLSVLCRSCNSRKRDT